MFWYVLTLIHKTYLDIVREYFICFPLHFYYAELSYSLLPFTNLLAVTECDKSEKHLRTVIKEGFQRQKLQPYL